MKYEIKQPRKYRPTYYIQPRCYNIKGVVIASRITSVISGQSNLIFIKSYPQESTRKYEHITPILQRLHWLPVRQRIHFKMLLITYKYINDMASEYQCELESIRKSSRKLSVSAQVIW